MGGHLMAGDGEGNEALVDLQTRLAFQEQAITELNGVIVNLQREIDQLNIRLGALKDRLNDLEESTGPLEDQEKPPHY